MPQDQQLLKEFKNLLLKNDKKTFIDFDEKFNHKFSFQIHRWEDVLKNTNRLIPPNKWSYYRVGLITRGSGDFLTGAIRYKATKNTIILIPPGLITSSKNWSMDAEGFMAAFNLEFFYQKSLRYIGIENKKILTSIIRPFITVNDQQAEQIGNLFETILTEQNQALEFEGEMTALKIIEFLIISERILNENKSSRAQNSSLGIVSKFIDLVEVNFAKEHQVKFYASKLAIHPNYLNSLIKTYTGISAKESIQNRLLIEIKYLLHTTALSIKEISNRVGFKDQNYFSVFFSKFENMSPLNYRSSFL